MRGDRFRRGRRYGRYDDEAYGPPYGGGGYRPIFGYRRYGPAPYGGSCLRDACLLETGCCLAEGLEGNCLVLTGPLALKLLGTLGSVAMQPLRRRPDRRASAAGWLVDAIRLYQQRVSAHRPPCCRFEPSCSAYAAEAISRHGARHGSWLAARRLVRCRPGARRGLDPVPQA
jgi:putative membrane protein insertion efficiency factor